MERVYVAVRIIVQGRGTAVEDRSLFFGDVVAMVRLLVGVSKALVWFNRTLRSVTALPPTVPGKCYQTPVEA